MSEKQHTPGPWVAGGPRYDNKPRVWVADSQGRSIAYMDRVYYGEPGNALANATLMAAAPDLREALERLLDRYTGLINSGDAGFWNPETEAEVIAARAALARATGTTPTESTATPTPTEGNE